MMSEMMNNHIDNFLAGTANGEGSITGVWCPPKATSEWLTAPPTNSASNFQPEQQKKVNPKNAHKMPIIGRGIERAAPQRDITEFANGAEQARESAEHVHRVDGGKNIEERAVGVGGEVQALRTELQPSHVLSGDEEQSEAERKIEPRTRRCDAGARAAHVRGHATSGNFETAATSEK